MSELNGFAWFAQQRLRPYWVIQLPVYGSFLFQGTEGEAEEMRSHKASWEREPAQKRPASFPDFTEIDRCWNHRGFIRLYWFGSRGRRLKKPWELRFACKCGGCGNG